jgi:hypothetical protein
MQTNRPGAAIILLITSGFASAAMSGFGLMAGGWGRFWRGSSTGDTEVAETAQRWGQKDDITVLTVMRAGKLEAVNA